MTASVTGSPRYASASAFSFCRIIALISGGAYSLPAALTRTSPFGPCTTSYGTIVISSVTSENLRPMKRLIEKMVFSGFVTCCRRAGAPTSRWPSFVKATTDGVVRPPSAFGITVGSPPSRTAMHEFVVPRSIPSVFAIPVVYLLVRKSKPLYSRFVEGMGAAYRRRLVERLRERRPAAPRHPFLDLRLALGSMGLGIGVTAVANSNAPGGGGVAITIVAWIAIAIINVAYAWR